MSINLFTFYWDDVANRDYNPNNWFGNSSLHDVHALFNGAFVQAFQRQLYTTPFTTYTDAGVSNFGVGSQLRGTGETSYGIEAVRAWILSAANQVGIVGNPNDLHVDLRSIEQIQQGQQLQDAPSGEIIHTGALQEQLDALKKSIEDGLTPDLLSTLGISTGVLIALGIGALYLFTRSSSVVPVRYLRSR